MAEKDEVQVRCPNCQFIFGVARDWLLKVDLLCCQSCNKAFELNYSVNQDAEEGY